MTRASATPCCAPGMAVTAARKTPQFERNAAECARLGIQYGVYWYSYASTPAEARQEARCCLAAIKGKHLCLPVAYDIEYEPCILRLTNAQRTALVLAFLSEIEAAGYYGILYASCDFIRNRLDYEVLSKYDIWVAQSRQCLHLPARRMASGSIPAATPWASPATAPAWTATGSIKTMSS